MKALVLNALGHGFEFEDVDIAAPMGREVLVNVRAAGLCHTDLLFATHDIVPTPAVLGHEVAGVVAEVGPEVGQYRSRGCGRFFPSGRSGSSGGGRRSKCGVRHFWGSASSASPRCAAYFIL